MKRIKKVIRIINNHGLINGGKIILNKISHPGALINHKVHKRDLFKFYEYVYFNSNKANFLPYNFKSIKIIWFIPDFGIGSGGHLNIFRMIFNLSKLGIKSDIAICGESQWLNAKNAKKTIDNNFFKLDSEIIILEKKDDIAMIKEYHIAMATSWQSAYYVNNFSNCYKKTYFIQDYEPYFYPVGSSYIFAENTYKFGFYGITAGSWLSNKIANEYKMDCKSFSFSYDRNMYFKHPRKEKKRRVFFYARPPTDRRAFELGILALKNLCDINHDLEIILAGWDTSEYYIPFSHFNAGVVALNELSDLYSQCDVALVLSFTNLSLLPLEILASGCPVISNLGENNSWIDKEKKLFIYTENNIENIVKKLDGVLNYEISPNTEYIEKFLEKTSWEKEAKVVFNIINTLMVDKK